MMLARKIANFTVSCLTIISKLMTNSMMFAQQIIANSMMFFVNFMWFGHTIMIASPMYMHQQKNQFKLL